MFADMLRPIAAAGLIWLAAAPAGTAPVAANVEREADPEIIIEGRRTGDRYRLPEKFRRLARADAPRGPTASDPRLACHNVGAYGCGTEVLPIVTVRGDGSMQIGAEPEREQ